MDYLKLAIQTLNYQEAKVAIKSTKKISQTQVSLPWAISKDFKQKISALSTITSIHTNFPKERLWNQPLVLDSLLLSTKHHHQVPSILERLAPSTLCLATDLMKLLPKSKQVLKAKWAAKAKMEDTNLPLNLLNSLWARTRSPPTIWSLSGMD